MKHRNGILVVLLTTLAFGACKRKELSQKEDFDFNKSFSIASEFNEASSELHVTIHLADSLHAYAAGEKVGKPVNIEIAPKNGWAADGPAIIPSGTKKTLGDLGESVVLEGNVVITQKLKKGSGKGEALLHLQVCTEKICDRPRTHQLPINTDQVKTEVTK